MDPKKTEEATTETASQWLTVLKANSTNNPSTTTTTTSVVGINQAMHPHSPVSETWQAQATNPSKQLLLRCKVQIMSMCHFSILFLQDVDSIDLFSKFFATAKTFVMEVLQEGPTISLFDPTVWCYSN